MEKKRCRSEKEEEREEAFAEARPAAPRARSSASTAACPVTSTAATAATSTAGGSTAACPVGYGVCGAPTCPEGVWLWLGDPPPERVACSPIEGYNVRFGRDRKVTGDGVYSRARAGAFTIFVYQHQLPATGLSADDKRSGYEVCFDTREIGPGEIFLYGDAAPAPPASGPGVLMLAGRGYS